jgi:hypothetical protein
LKQAFGFEISPLVGREDLQAMTLYSEQAFYYSFFLRSVTAPTLAEAVGVMFVDASSEFPNVVIPVQR